MHALVTRLAGIDRRHNHRPRRQNHDQDVQFSATAPRHHAIKVYPDLLGASRVPSWTAAILRINALLTIRHERRTWFDDAAANGGLETMPPAVGSICE
jgi:hypothetical protein